MDDIVKLGARVAAQLGPGWQATPGPFDTTATLLHPDGRRLRMDESQGRVYVRGQYPDGPTPYQTSDPRISAAISRGPAAIAADITRRLLPTYEEQMAEVRRFQEEEKRRRQKLEQATRRILVLLPGSYIRDFERTNHDITVRWNLGATLDDGRAEIRLTGDGSSAELWLRHLPYELVEAALSALARSRCTNPAS